MSALPGTPLPQPDADAPIPAAPTPAAAPAPSPTDARAGSGAALVDVVALTTDLTLFASTREAVGERSAVWRAQSAEEAADLLITGRCGVLLIDTASVSTQADTLIGQIAEQFPDVVICVAGTRADEPLLAPLISEGLVYRFLHKPTSARRAGMFLQAAVRRHLERRDGDARGPALPLLGTLARPAAGLPRWSFVAIALLALALTVPLFVDDGAEMPAGTVVTAASNEPARPAAPAQAAATRADPVLSRARAALQSGRLESPQGRNALDLYAAVLLAQPGQAEALVGLERTIERLLDQARDEAAAGRKAEADRLLQRVLVVSPRHEATLALQRQLNPPDSPSQQLAREEAELAGLADLAEPAPPVPEDFASATALPAPAEPPPRLRVPVTDLSAPVPVTKLPTRASPRPVVRPDPLAPHYSNGAAPAPALVRPRTFGGRVANPLPIAGTASTDGASGAGSSAVATTAPPAELLRVPADSLDRISARDPVYPPEALRSGTRGWVELEFTITPAGTVRDIQVVGAEPTGVFDAAAVEALAQWRFRPRVVNGQAVPQRSSVRIRFDLDG